MKHERFAESSIVRSKGVTHSALNERSYHGSDHDSRRILRKSVLRIKGISYSENVSPTLCYVVEFFTSMEKHVDRSTKKNNNIDNKINQSSRETREFSLTILEL